MSVYGMCVLRYTQFYLPLEDYTLRDTFLDSSA